MKKKKGFTLVELLAVIVILAVILIIAMPKISDVIKNSKEASLETTAKLIASQAEKKYTENQVLDNSSTIKCSDVAKISDADYESCNITFDSKGNAKVSIVGKGKFEGMAVCNANKNSASISSDCATNASYFTYEDTSIIHSAEIVDVDKCKAFMQNPVGCTETQANTFCTTGSLTINNKTLTVNDLALEVSTLEEEGYSYETVGLKVDATEGISITGYNIEGGTDVVIPSQIDGKTVVAIGNRAFNDITTNYGIGITSVVLPSTLETIGDYAFANNKLTNITLPSSIIRLGENAFSGNQITSIIFPDTPITLGCWVFEGNPIMKDGNYSFPSNVVLPDSSKCEGI